MKNIRVSAQGSQARTIWPEKKAEEIPRTSAIVVEIMLWGLTCTQSRTPTACQRYAIGVIGLSSRRHLDYYNCAACHAALFICESAANSSSNSLTCPRTVRLKGFNMHVGCAIFKTTGASKGQPGGNTSPSDRLPDRERITGGLQRAWICMRLCQCTSTNRRAGGNWSTAATVRGRRT